MRLMVRTYLLGLFDVTGMENVPRTGPLIICANHSATLDPPLVPAFVPRADTWTMAKAEFFRSPLMALIFRMYHAFPVVRHTADRTAVRRALDILKAGDALLMYPEGTRVEFGVLQKRADGSRVSHDEASDAIMVAIAALLPPEQRGVFSDLESHRKRLAGVTRSA